MPPATNPVDLGSGCRVWCSLPLLAGIWVWLRFAMEFLVVLSHTLHGFHPLREILVCHVRVLTGLNVQVRLDELALFVQAPRASLVPEPRIFGRLSQAELPASDVASHRGADVRSPEPFLPWDGVLFGPSA